MPHKTWIALGFCLVSAVSLQAQDCNNLDPTKPGDATRAFDCVSLLDQKLSDAMSEFETLQASVAALSSQVSALANLETESEATQSELERVSARVSGLSKVVSEFSFDADLARIIGRVGTLERDVENLENESTAANIVPAQGRHKDTRAIVAYTSEKGERTCPPGWKPFEEAKDRFILGAGNKYQVVGSTGGEETVKLEERHMPSHRHGLAYLSITTNLGFKDGGTNTNIPYADVPRSRASGRSQVKFYGPEDGVTATGGNQPHNNMPPWIALYYCIKE